MPGLFHSLRFRLILLVLLAVIPALGITLFSGMEQRRLDRANAVGDAYRYTRLVSDYQASLTESSRQLMLTLSTIDGLDNPATCQATLRRMGTIYPVYAAISIAKQTGQVTCSSVAMDAATSIRDRAYFQQAVHSGDFVIGTATIGRLSKKPVIPYALPVFNSSHTIQYVLVLTLDMNQLIQYGVEMNLPPQSTIMIVDGQGTVLLRYPEGQQWVGKQLPNVPIIHELLLKKGEGSAEVRGVDGVKRLYAFTPIHSAPEMPMYMTIGIPSSVAYSAADQAMAISLTWIGIAALLALAAAWWGGDVLFLRIVSLTAERDAAEHSLREANALLEVRVQDRTAELAQANERLHSTVASLRQREAEMNYLLFQIKESNRDLQDFAYIASHDLQEPLRKIQAFGDRLAKRYAGQLGEEGSDFIQRMNLAAGRMQAMINDLLTYSRVNTRGQAFVPVDLNEIVDDVLSVLELRMHETGGHVEVQYLGIIDADPTQMHMLLQNLIGNALKFHRPGVPPLIKVTREETHSENAAADCNQVTLVVEDNGIGFDEKYLDRIFQPFQRLHGRDKYEGSGVGLAVCRKIAERHNGQLTAVSTPGVGSRFILTIPEKQAKKEQEKLSQ